MDVWAPVFYPAVAVAPVWQLEAPVAATPPDSEPSLLDVAFNGQLLSAVTGTLAFDSGVEKVLSDPRVDIYETARVRKFDQLYGVAGLSVNPYFKPTPLSWLGVLIAPGMCDDGPWVVHTLGGAMQLHLIKLFFKHPSFRWDANLSNGFAYAEPGTVVTLLLWQLRNSQPPRDDLFAIFDFVMEEKRKYNWQRLRELVFAKPIVLWWREQATKRRWAPLGAATMCVLANEANDATLATFAERALHQEQLLRILTRHMGAWAAKEVEDEASARVAELLSGKGR